MKSLKFNHIEAENIKRGIQKATLRVRDEKEITVDDEILIIDKVHEEDPNSWQIIGTALISKVSIQKIGDLDLDGAEFEKFGSMTDLYKQLKIFYGDPINETTNIKVIHFDFKEYEQPDSFNNIDETNTTKVSEIKLYGDGGSRGNPGPSASGYVLMDMRNNILETNGEFLHTSTNNQAEYHSLRLGLERAEQIGARVVHVFMDSLLVINQMKGIYKVKNKELLSVHSIIKELIKDFDYVEFTHIPRELNTLADGEVNRILDSYK